MTGHAQERMYFEKERTIMSSWPAGYEVKYWCKSCVTLPWRQPLLVKRHWYCNMLMHTHKVRLSPALNIAIQ